MADQVLSSGTGLLLLVLVARDFDTVVFGALNLVVIINGLLLGTVRAAVGEIVLLRCRRYAPAARDEAARGLFLALVVGVTSGLGLVVVGTAIGGTVGHLLQLIGLAAPLVHTHDVLRYVAYGTGRVVQAVEIDGVWLGVQAIGSAALLATGHATPGRLVLAWAAGAGAGPVVGELRQQVRRRSVGLGRWWTEERARSTGFVTDYLVSTGMVQGSFILLGVLLPLEQFGALRVAFVSLTPMANLLAGVRTLTLAHLAGLRSTPDRARRRAGQLAAGFAGAGVAYGAALAMLPGHWGAQLFGESWAEASGLIAIVAVGQALRLGTFAPIDLVKVLGAPMDLVRTRAFAATGVVAGLLLGAAVAGPVGAATCMTIGSAAAAALWWRQALIAGGTSSRAEHRVAGHLGGTEAVAERQSQ